MRNGWLRPAAPQWEDRENGGRINLNRNASATLPAGRWNRRTGRETASMAL
jgi:hypothetical protein